MTQKGSFRTGADAAKAAQKSGGFQRTEYFRIEDGDEAILRFITDAREDPNRPHVEAWITVDQHQMVPTKPKPDGWEGNWPKSMSAVCRYDDAFAGIYSDCYICDHIVDDNRVRKPSARIWALAVLREKVIGDGSEKLGGPDLKGKLVGYTDQTRSFDVKDDNGKEKKVTEKAVVVVNMGWKNFYNALEGFSSPSMYGTVLDRDYWIKRSGAGTDTTYQIAGLDPIPGHDLRDEETMEKYSSNYDLGEIVSEMASDKFYGKFFDPRYTVGEDGEAEQTSTDVPAEAQQKPDGEADPDKLAALAARVKGTTSKEDAEAKPEAAEGSGLVNLDS